MDATTDEVVEKRQNARWIRYAVGVGVIVIAAIATCTYLFAIAPHNRAVSAFESSAAQVRDKNSALQEEIDAAQHALDAGEAPLDVGTQDALTVAIANARLSLRVIPDMPSSTSDIEAAVESLNQPLDYSANSQALQETKAAFENSVRQLRQVTAPSQDFVISRLGQVSDVSDIQAATEEKDPNKSLNKAGSYTAAVFFHYNNLSDPDGLYSGKPSIDNGTDGGGCIEVFRTVEDAKKRNDYLAVFDGASIINPGSHKVVGTVVIRTSHLLTASQQDALTAEIEAGLTAVD